MGNLLMVIGLISELIGILFLGSAFFNLNYETIRKQILQVWGIHPLNFNELVFQRIKGITGTILLFNGWLHHAIVYLEISFKVLNIIIVIWNVILVTGLFIFRKITISYLSKKVNSDEQALTKEEQEDSKMYYL